MAGLKPQMRIVLITANRLYKELFNAQLVVTSALDGIHSAGSAHYFGYALDFRTYNLGTMKQTKAKRIADELQHRLGGRYYVLLESNHIHVNLKYQFWNKN